METQSRAATLIRWSSRLRHWSPGSQSTSTRFTFSPRDGAVFVSEALRVLTFSLYRKLTFFCFSTSSWVQKLCKSNRVWNESTKGAQCQQMASVHHDFQLKLHASTKTYPPGLALFCPKAPWPTRGSSETEKPLGPSSDSLLTMPVSFCNNGSQWRLSQDLYIHYGHFGEVVVLHALAESKWADKSYCMITRKSPFSTVNSKPWSFWCYCITLALPCSWIWASTMCFFSPPIRFVTLTPGDVFLTGTPPGVGVFRKPPVFLKVISWVKLKQTCRAGPHAVSVGFTSTSLDQE